MPATCSRCRATCRDATGTLVEPLANALHSVERAVREGDDVLVIGAGPIGLFAARASVLAGAARTFVVDRLADRLAWRRASAASPYRSTARPRHSCPPRGGAGVDVVIDAAGFASTWSLGDPDGSIRRTYRRDRPGRRRRARPTTRRSWRRDSRSSAPTRAWNGTSRGRSLLLLDGRRGRRGVDRDDAARRWPVGVRGAGRRRAVHEGGADSVRLASFDGGSRRVVTAERISDPQGLGIRCLVNGEVLADSPTRRVGARTPPRWLQDEDVVKVEIERIGALTNEVRATARNGGI